MTGRKIYAHPVYLAEIFVDISRFEGTCYRAANWRCVGHTRGSAKKGTLITITVNQRPYTCIPCIPSSGGICWIRRDEAEAILRPPTDQTVGAILALAEKTEKYDQLLGDVIPMTPSGMTPMYLKPSPARRRKGPGKKTDHGGISRIKPEEVDYYKEYTLRRCPECHSLVRDPITTYTRYVEDITAIAKPEVTRHTLHGYWCSTCKKVVFPILTDALPNAMIRMRLVVFIPPRDFIV